MSEAVRPLGVRTIREFTVASKKIDCIITGVIKFPLYAGLPRTAGNGIKNLPHPVNIAVVKAQ